MQQAGTHHVDAQECKGGCPNVVCVQHSRHSTLEINAKALGAVNMVVV